METSAQAGERFRQGMIEASRQATALDAALALASHGIPSFPCINSTGGAGKRPQTMPKWGFCGDPELDADGKPVIDPRTRRPKEVPGTGGFHKATTNAERLRGAFTDSPKALVGIAPERPMVCLDMDVPGPGHSGDGNGIETVKALEAKHGGSARTFTTRTPGGGLHGWYTLPEGVELPQGSGLLPGLDTRTPGKGYAVEFGTLEDGRSYGIHDDAPVAEMPEWLVGELLAGKEAQRKAKEQASAPASAQEPWTSPGMFRDALRLYELPARYYEEAFRRECDILRSTTKNRNDQLNATCFNVGQLVGEGGVHEEQAVDALERIARDIGLEDAEIRATIKSGIEKGKLHPRIRRSRKEPEAEPSGPMEFITLEDASRLESGDYAIKGLLPAKGVAMIFGEPACGKSFTMLSACIHMAEAWPICGRRTKRRAIFYLSLEGGAGLGKRIQAFKAWARLAGKPELSGDFRFWTHGFALHKWEQCQALCDAVNGAGCEAPPVIIIDTLSQSCLGLDENTSEMAQAIGNATRIAEAVNGLVVAVHHVGKDTTKGPRGHSSLMGNVDVAIFASRDRRRKTTEWTVHKAKDDSDGHCCTFRLRVFEVGTDADGDKITSCAAEPVAPAEPAKKNGSKRPYGGLLRPGSNAAFAFDAFREAVAESGSDGSATLEEWRAIYYRLSPAEPESKRVQFSKDRKTLVDKRILRVENDIYTVNGIVVQGFDEWP